MSILHARPTGAANDGPTAGARATQWDAAHVIQAGAISWTHLNSAKPFVTVTPNGGPGGDGGDYGPNTPGTTTLGIQEAHTGNKCVKITPGAYKFGESFTGILMVTGREIELEAGADLIVKNGYAGNVFHWDDGVAYTYLHGGGRITEAGATPRQLWDCYYMHSGTTPAGVYFNLVTGIYAYDFLNLIHLKCDSTSPKAWINGNKFVGLTGNATSLSNPNVGILFDLTVAQGCSNGMNDNIFRDIFLEFNGSSTAAGVKNVSGASNEFHSCQMYDLAGRAVCANMLPTASLTVIKGGLMTHLNFDDSGVNSLINTRDVFKVGPLSSNIVLNALAGSVQINSKSATNILVAQCNAATQLVINNVGKVSEYNTIATAGAGLPFILAAGNAVTWSGSSTRVCSKTIPAVNTSFMVLGSVQTHNNRDRVTITLTYTSSPGGDPITQTMMNAVALSSPAEVSFVAFGRALASTTISVQIVSALHSSTIVNAIIAQVS